MRKLTESEKAFLRRASRLEGLTTEEREAHYAIVSSLFQDTEEGQIASNVLAHLRAALRHQTEFTELLEK